MITEKDISKEELKKKMLKEYEIEHKYFLDENGKNHWLKKPFSGIEEAGSYCMQLGRLIDGLKLARGIYTKKIKLIYLIYLKLADWHKHFDVCY